MMPDQPPDKDEAAEPRTERPALSKPSLDFRAATLASAGALAGLLAGVSQFLGWIEFTVTRAAVAILIGIAFAWAAPGYLARRHEKDHEEPADRQVIRTVAWASALIFVLFIVVPVAWKLNEARASTDHGLEDFRSQRYPSAVGALERATTLFDESGVESWGRRAQIALVETYAALGRRGRALDLADELEQAGLADQQRGQLLGARANIAASFGEMERADRLYQQAESLLDPNSRQYASVLHNEASTLLDRGSIRAEPAIEKLVEARAVYEQIEDRLGIAYVLATEADTEPYPAARREKLEEALVLAEEEGDHGLVASIKESIGRSFQHEGRLEEAEQMHLEALRAFEELADPLGQATAYANLASVSARRAENAVASNHLSESRALLDTLDLAGNEAPPRRLATLLSLQAVALESLGDPSGANDKYMAALEILAGNPYPLLRAEILVNLGTFLFSQGDVSDAERHLDEAEALLSGIVTTDESRLLGVVERARAALLSQRGDVGGAFAHSERSLEILSASGDRVAEAESAIAHAALLNVVEGTQAAAEFLGGYVPDIEASGNSGLLAETLLTLYNMTTDGAASVELAERLLQLTTDPNLPAATETLILTSLLVDDLVALNALVVVQSELRELVDAQTLAPNQTALAHLQIGRIENDLGQFEQSNESLRLSLEHVGALVRDAQSGHMWEVGELIVANGAPGEGVPLMWEAFLDATATRFRIQPFLEEIWSERLALIVIEQSAALDLNQQIESATRALELATSDESRATLLALIQVLETESASESPSAGQPSVAVPAEFATWDIFRVALGEQIMLLAVADRLEKRDLGLRGIADLHDLDGLLYVYPEPQTDIAHINSESNYTIDILMFDGEGNYLGFAPDVPPCTTSSCPAYGTQQEVQYVVEAISGVLALDSPLRLDPARLPAGS